MITIEKNNSDLRKIYPYKKAYTDKNNKEMFLRVCEIRYYTSLNENGNPKIFELKNRIYDFLSLQNNWDSYDADKISQESISIAIQLIELLYSNNIIIDYAFPMSDGGIQLEKDFDNFSIEIEINPEEKVKLLVFDKKNNLIKEKDYEILESDNLIVDVKEHYGDL